MLDTIKRYVNSFVQEPLRTALFTMLMAFGDRLSSQTLTTGGLAITSASATTAKTVNTVVALCNGVLVSKAAGNLPALAGTINQNNFGGWAFYMDSGGNLSSVFMNQASTLAGVTFPQQPAGQAMLGFVYLNPTTANFVGGTTALDAANTNAVYVNTLGALDPSILTGN